VRLYPVVMDVAGQRRTDGLRPAAWKVGELAGRTGVSVRALRYYDEIGLLSPSRRSEGGHRLYTAEDVVRLQRIKSLTQLGFTLREVRGCLDRPDFLLERVVRLHLARLRERIELQRRLCERLERVSDRLSSGEDVSSEEFIETVMEVIDMSERIEKYYTPEQLEYLEQRRNEVGEERIREVEAEWPDLMEQVRAEMEAGTDPSEERVQALARRWMGLVREFTGGDQGIERSLNNMWSREENVHGIDTSETRELGEYVSRALAASGEASSDEECGS
jgi:MerR family transcriptional regulator, thiopeptide resistance regulator